MRSRIVAILLSVLLFFSTLYLIGFPEKEVPAVEITETKPPENVETVVCSFSDISYGPDKKQRLNLTLPVDNREETGLVLYIHGGGWRGGNKDRTNVILSSLSTSKDYAVASMNYRLTKQDNIDIYDMINDITAAISHIKAFAQGYSVNISRVAIMGHSAGGHLALLYSYRYKDVSPVDIAGVIALASPADLTLDAFYNNSALGDENYVCSLVSRATGEKFTPDTRDDFSEILLELSPISYVSSDCAPTVICHGKKDSIVPVEDSIALAEKLDEYSVENDLVICENSGHKFDKDEEALKTISTLLQERLASWFRFT